MLKEKAGRHFWIAENLLRCGYRPSVFCASTNHITSENIREEGKKAVLQTVDGIPFIFVSTPDYTGNGKKRVVNMISFYRKLFPVSNEYARLYGKPDIIIASSVHPLTLVAGIKLAKKYGVPCICEVRDLWPESIVAYGLLKRNNPIAKILYKGEKWIYKKADAIIMTWEGGKDYITERGWDKDIDLDKVRHINNGVDLEAFDRYSEEYILKDDDLDDDSHTNIVYTGSIRMVNNIGMLLDAAKLIKALGARDIRFLIYGSGDESEALIRRCADEGIDNVVFKGRIEKKYIPYVLKKAYMNILHNSSTSLDKYGQSQNKFFEYLAAGKGVFQTYSTGYSIAVKYDCGIVLSVQNAENIAKAVIDASVNPERCAEMGGNARKAAEDYDFRKLTGKLVDIIEEL
jgi:glycosyltransferase involved in cell wall biosynthesis